MASSKIPEEISKYRPGPCTEIKLINGHYYVYMYQSVHLPSGKWGKKTGKSIGSIIPDKGFVPNRNYHLYTGEEPKDDISILEYGQYALIESVAREVRIALEEHFPLDRASQIFAYACILYANGFTHLDQVQSYYEQSWLVKEYENFTFKMGKTALGSLLDDLGRRTQRVINYENALLNSASTIAIDGHAIRSCSEENDLGETGYKFRSLKKDQVNLLMGYDINTGLPLFSRMLRGSCNDKATLEELNDLLVFSNILFVVDRGFYSAKYLKLMSTNDNTYIIPLPSNTDAFKKVMKNLKYTNSFYYRSGRKHARIEYMSERISDTEYVYVFRDIDENEKCRFNNQHNIDLGAKGFTSEKLEEQKDNLGVYVFQSNAALSPEVIFDSYKKCWGIETLYPYLKNKGDFNDLMIQDYYKEQGMSFIMLIAGQIHQKMIAAVKTLNDNTLSTQDILIMARCMKMERRGNSWNLRNTRKRDMEVLKKLGFEPIMVVTE